MTLNGIGELMTAVGLAGLLFAEWNARPALRVVAKPFASLGFIVAAIGFGALESRYGSIVFVGLLLGAIGDVCLLGNARGHLLAGLAAFLLGHVAYTVAFASLGISSRHALMAATALAVVMVFVARWAFPHTQQMRFAIGIYMLVIGAMCTIAIGAGGLHAPWMVPLGASMFALSDIAVLRDRFIVRRFANKLFGLPLYYAAQLLIAWSIKAVSG